MASARRGPAVVERATGTEVAVPMKNSSLRGPSPASDVGSSPKPRRAPGARVSSIGTEAVATTPVSDCQQPVGSEVGGAPGDSASEVPPAAGLHHGCRGGAHGGRGRARPRGVTLATVPCPSSPTCTSTTTTVMLSAPPCSLAAWTSRPAACSGSSTVRRISAISSIPTSLLSPSEHTNTLSPACSSSSHMSASTSEDTPRARVRMWRCR